MSNKSILVWFRNDLRVHDNEILHEAVQKSSRIIPVYIFDPRYYSSTPFGTQKTGKFRTKFILESVQDLKTSLQNLGGDLLVLNGKPEEILPGIVKKYQADEVYHHREVAAEETGISSSVEDALWKMQINLKHFIGHTLYHKEDLPFPIKDIPDIFNKFRKKTEREGEIRPVFPTPESITVPEDLETSAVPSLKDLGFDDFDLDERAVLDFKGGETEGLKRLHYYLWDSDLLKKYKQTRDQLIGGDYSSKLSPWLSAGCLSPREVYWEVNKYEKERGSNDSTYLLIFELLWRDYFRFMFKKHGTHYFIPEESNDPEKNLTEEDTGKFEKWKQGETGMPFIDANMRELLYTGFMSSRGRQNVASYFVNELGLNWTLGAAYFEEMLIDYSPSSNWGNWAYIAGPNSTVVPLNIARQAKDFDPQAEYMKLWLPDMKNISSESMEELHKI